MTSKNWYFNLAKEDFKRRVWLLALTALILFFSFPVLAMLYVSAIDGYSDYEMGLRQFQLRMAGLVGAGNTWVCFLMFVFALAYGLSGFAYLDSKSKVDFYHSLPVRREKLFLVKFVDGFVGLAILYAAFLGLAVVLGVGSGAQASDLLGAAATSYALNLSFFLLLYATVIAAVMLTGKMLTALLGCAVFGLIMPTVGGLWSGLCNTFLLTYYDSADGFALWCAQISPFGLYVMALDSQEYVKYGTIAAVAGVAVVVIALFLYRKRPSEGAGKSLVFAISKPLVKIPIVLCSGIGGGLFGWSLRGTMGWSAFGLICGTVISHCVIEIIYHADFKKLFAHPLHLAGCIAAAMAILCGFRFDLLGYDRYLPDAGALSSVGVDIEELDNWIDYGHLEEWTAEGNRAGFRWEWENRNTYIWENMKMEDVGPALDIVARGLEETAKARTTMGGRSGRVFGPYYQYRASGGDTANNPYISVSIQFNKRGGGKFTRHYLVPYRQVEGAVMALYGQEAFKRALYPILGQKDALVYVNYNKFDGSKLLGQGDPQLAERLRQAYCQDLLEQTAASRQAEIPIAQIRFVTEQEDRLLRQYRDRTHEWERGDVLGRAMYPIYPSFSRTLACLADAGQSPKQWPADHRILSGELYLYSDITDDNAKYERSDAYPLEDTEFVETETRYGSSLTQADVETLLPSSVYVPYHEMNLFAYVPMGRDGLARLSIAVDQADGFEPQYLDFYLPQEGIPEQIWPGR